MSTEVNSSIWHLQPPLINEKPVLQAVQLVADVHVKQPLIYCSQLIHPFKSGVRIYPAAQPVQITEFVHELQLGIKDAHVVQTPLISNVLGWHTHLSPDSTRFDQGSHDVHVSKYVPHVKHLLEHGAHKVIGGSVNIPGAQVIHFLRTEHYKQLAMTSEHF